MRLKAIFVGIIILLCIPSQNGQSQFSEYPSNPVYSPGRAYYPSIVYDSLHFGDAYGGGLPYYKMWYSTSGGIALAYSTDGITWNTYGLVSGLLATAHHVQVIYDRNGFGGTPFHYKMWFWDTSQLYSLAALKYAESVDGITWSWSSLSQDATYQLVTGVHPDWNRGTYGPIDIFYNPAGSASFDDTAVWNNKYVMYYDGTTGGIEQVGLAYSINGTHWKRYGSGPVLPITAGSWDSAYTGFGTVIPLPDGFHFFYSGGQHAMHEGIGYAFSTDGISWEKADDPLFHVHDGMPWRSTRCYTPSVLVRRQGGVLCFHMWFTGDDGSTRAIGYAVGCVRPPLGGSIRFPPVEIGIEQQMISLARYNTDRCCEQYEQTVMGLLSELLGVDEPEYEEALQYIEQARTYCTKSDELITSGNGVAGNYCALQACELYAQALSILEALASELA
jgi:hypothetical protein